jgi:hypothetical protein
LIFVADENITDELNRNILDENSLKSVNQLTMHVDEPFDKIISKILMIILRRTGSTENNSQASIDSFSLKNNRIDIL